MKTDTNYPPQLNAEDTASGTRALVDRRELDNILSRQDSQASTIDGLQKRLREADDARETAEIGEQAISGLFRKWLRRGKIALAIITVLAPAVGWYLHEVWLPNRPASPIHIVETK